MSLFTEYKSLAFINGFMDVVSAITLVLFTVLAGRLIRKADENTGDITIMLVGLFFAVPCAISALYPRLHSIERFIILFTVLSLIVINRKGWKWLVPFFIVGGLASYQGFAFTYMPAVAVVLIYGVYRDNTSRQSVALCVVGFITMAVFSAYFFLYPGISSYETAEALILAFEGKTDFVIGTESTFSFGWPYTEVVRQFLIRSPGEFQEFASSANDILGGLRTEARVFLRLSPLVLFFGILWISALRKSKNKLEKFIFLLCLFAPLARTPMFLLSQNFFRGRVAVIIVQFFLLFYFLYSENRCVRDTIENIGSFLKRFELAYYLVIAYLALPFFSYSTGTWWKTILTFFRQ